MSLTAILSFAGCSAWTADEPVDMIASHPWERDPQTWEQYKADLRAYKQRSHKLVYIRFDNAAEKPSGEKNFMRCLPDSLDFVSLTNAGNFSVYDAQDMEWMRSVGTKVLYGIDFSQQTDLGKAVKTVKENGLDGFSLRALAKEDGIRIHETLPALSGCGLIVCEGNPVLLAAEDLDRIDLFVLPSDSVENPYSLNSLIQDALDCGVQRDRIILAVSMTGTWYDSSNSEKPAVQSMTDNVTLFGPLAGLALYDVMSDYSHYEGNWITIRTTISRLNP